MSGITDRSWRPILVEPLGLEDSLAYEVVVGPPGRRLDEASQHEVAGVRIGVAAAGRIQRLAPGVGDQFLRFEPDGAVTQGAKYRTHAVAGGVGVVADTGRMRQQVANTDVVGVGKAPVPRRIAEPLRRGVVEAQHAVLHQQHRQRRNEGLARAPAGHANRIVEGNVRLPVRQAYRGADDAAIREAHGGP